MCDGGQRSLESATDKNMKGLAVTTNEEKTVRILREGHDRYSSKLSRERVFIDGLPLKGLGVTPRYNRAKRPKIIAIRSFLSSSLDTHAIGVIRVCHWERFQRFFWHALQQMQATVKVHTYQNRE